MRKILLMACMLISLLFPWSLSAQEPSFSFPKKEMTLSEALSIIEKQSGYSIAYNEDLLDLKKTVSTPSNKTLSETLSIVLKETGTEAKIKNSMILIVKKTESKGKQTYKGIVLDNVGPVIGAVIQVDGASDVATTALDGSFRQAFRMRRSH